MSKQYITIEGISEDGIIVPSSPYIPKGKFRVLITFFEPIPDVPDLFQDSTSSVLLSPEEKLDRTLAGLQISSREYEILLLIHKGYTNGRIAQELELGDGTVRNYVSSLLTKVKATNRTQLINLAISKGLITSQ